MAASILGEMRSIAIKKMLELWDQLLWMEKVSDFELAQRAGLSSGTISFWRGKNAPETVRLSTLGAIERGLGYKCELLPSGKWEIKKLHTAGEAKNEAWFSKSKFAQLDEEDREWIDKLAAKLAQLDNADRETIQKLIDSLSQKPK